MILHPQSSLHDVVIGKKCEYIRETHNMLEVIRGLLESLYVRFVRELIRFVSE
jgi:hypothetical protein